MLLDHEREREERMKDDNRMELAAIPIVLIFLGVLFAIMLLAEFGVWGWVVFGPSGSSGGMPLRFSSAST